jgi:hypothetical protein
VTDQRTQEQIRQLTKQHIIHYRELIRLYRMLRNENWEDFRRFVLLKQWEGTDQDNN